MILQAALPVDDLVQADVLSTRDQSQGNNAKRGQTGIGLPSPTLHSIAFATCGTYALSPWIPSLDRQDGANSFS